MTLRVLPSHFIFSWHMFWEVHLRSQPMAPGLTNLGLQGTLQTWFHDASSFHFGAMVSCSNSEISMGASLLRNSTPNQSHGFPRPGLPDRQESLGSDSAGGEVRDWQF